MKNLIALFITLSGLLLSSSSWAQDTQLDLSQYKGKVVYLDFWASWCGPCKESFPWLNELKKKYPDLKIIGVNLDKDSKTADEFLKKYPADFEIIYNPKGDMAEKFKVKGMPYSVIYNKKGENKFSHIGFSKAKSQKYIEEIESLLGEK